MGWASGSRLMSEIIKGLVESDVNADQREAFYRIVIPAMESMDWDTQDECEGEDAAYDKVLMELHPDWFEVDEEEDSDDWLIGQQLKTVAAFVRPVEIDGHACIVTSDYRPDRVNVIVENGVITKIHGRG